MLRLYISPFSNPFMNLALENQFMEELTDREDILFLYINDPSVVIGRFQNPWIECTPHKQKDTYLVRRQSGGGTVYHDRGNLNFSFIMSNRTYDRRRNLEQVCRIMKNCGVELEINDRHDLTVDYNKKTYKVSGSAFRHKKEKAFHHGTLLISTEPSRLKESITPGKQKKFTHISGTASKRSPVINLAAVKQDLSIPVVLDVFRNWFETHNDCVIAELSEEEWTLLSESEPVQAERTTLLSEDWILGKTPSFTQDISSIQPPETEGWEIRVNRGKIETAPEELKFLEGLHYGRRNTGDELKAKMEGLSLFQMTENEFFSRLIQLIG